MISWRILYHLVRADFMERVRRYSFLIVVGVTILAGYTFVPPYDARYAIGFLFCLMPPLERRCVMYARGIYNSAWVGTVVAFMIMNFLSLIGFYLVKNAIERDRETGVGQIVAATPLRKSLYIFGKWFSNLVVLVLMVAVLAVSALLMQLWRGEEMHINLLALLTPFLLMALPVMAITAALAILFEVIPWLRAGMGNVTYFFLWVIMLTTGVGQNMLGYTSFYPAIEKDFQAVFPAYRVFSSTGINPVNGELLLIRWEGIHWSSALIIDRLAWTGVALGIILVAIFLFRMHDLVRNLLWRVGVEAANRRPDWLSALYSHLFLKRVNLSLKQMGDQQAFNPSRVLSPIGPLLPTRCSGHLVLAELRILLKGQPWWWWAIGLGLLAVSWALQGVATFPRETLPLIGIWPVLVWSSMGVRESRHQTEQLIFSAAHSLRCQFSAIWLAGLCIAMITWSGVAVCYLFTENWGGLFSWGAGILFIPSLALALGSWSRSSKTFEVIYTILWYCGPMSGLSALDFIGATDAPMSIGKILAYLGFALILLGLAFLGRKRQVRS
jgi:hypothetical protein